MSKKELYLLDMFSMCCPATEYAEAFEKAIIVGADIDPTQMSADICVFCPAYIPQKELNQFADMICFAYQLSGGVRLTAKYPADQLNKLQWQEIAALFTAADSMNIASLAGAEWTWEGNKLTIQLRANGKALLEECAPRVCRSLKEQFSADVEIEIVAGQNADKDGIFAQMQKIRSEILANVPAPVQSVAQAPVKDDKAIFGNQFKAKPVPM